MFPALKAFHKKFISVYEPYTLPVIIFTKKMNNNKILNQKPVQKLQRK